MICAQCSEPTIRGVLCEKHRKSNLEAIRQKREKRKAEGKCHFCEELALPGKRLCQRHRDLSREATRKKREAKKLPPCPHCNGKGVIEPDVEE